MKIGILVVAYNAASTLAHVLDRIPVDFRPSIHEILVGDDHSHDSTYLVGLGYQQANAALPLHVVRHDENLGYGGNQKWGYQYAIEHGWDIVVLLHGDGQYAPEMLPAMVAPIVAGEADVVLGSRMMHKGEARRGGMPAYKYVGNRILTTVQNRVAGADLTEWHSGYRAYAVSALSEVPLQRNDDGFNFDTQVIVQMLEARKRILEIPIPTYYGDEICHVNGMRYAGDVVRDVVRYRAHKMGFGSGELAFQRDAYEAKVDEQSSHRRILSWMADRPPSRVLDLGCSDGQVAEQLEKQGHQVVGVDVATAPGVDERMSAFIEADLDDGLPAELEGEFDVVLCADVLEHVRQPEALLDAVREHLAPGGAVIVSLPNFAHWYPRARVALGRFDYDARGILDRGHLRFFTRRSFTRLVTSHGWEIRRTEALGLPLEVIERGASGREAGTVRRLLGRVDRAGVMALPNLFAYQHLFELGDASGQSA